MPGASIKYAMMPHDLFQRRWYVMIRRQFPDIMERWYWLVCLAQNARSAGRVLIGGEPATAEDVAIAWDRRSTEEDTAIWQRAIDAFVDAGILKVDDDCLRIDKPTGWYLPPSKQPHNRDHAREYAQEKSAREEPGRAGKTREEPVRPVHSTSTSTEPVPNQYRTRGRVGGGGESFGGPEPERKAQLGASRSRDPRSAPARRSLHPGAPGAGPHLRDRRTGRSTTRARHRGHPNSRTLGRLRDTVPRPRHPLPASRRPGARPGRRASQPPRTSPAPLGHRQVERSNP